MFLVVISELNKILSKSRLLSTDKTLFGFHLIRWNRASVVISRPRQPMRMPTDTDPDSSAKAVALNPQALNQSFDQAVTSSSSALGKSQEICGEGVASAPTIVLGRKPAGQ